MKTFVRIRSMLLFVLCNIFLVLQAQTGRFYSTEAGLSSSLINQLFQDSRGFLWGATEHGLNKFDGMTYSVYRHVGGDDTSLKNNYVRSLFESRRKELWVGCIDGLMRYDRETDTFREIPMMRNGRQVFPHVTQMCELHNGEVWISTSGQGMFCLDKAGERALSLDSVLHQANYNFQFRVLEDSHYNVWIGTEGNGLICYLPATGETHIYKSPSLTGDNISSLLEDEEGNLFVGVQGQGLLRYNRETRSFEEIPYEKGGRLSVDCMAMVNGKLLVGTDGQGLKIYHPERNRIGDCVINSAPLDFSEGKIHSLLQDKDGNLWLGLFQKGIVFIPRTENTFEYYGNKSIHYNPIGQGCVMAVFQDSNRHLWVGADNEGLFELDSEGRRLHHYKPTGESHSVANTVMCVYEDSERNLWIGSYMRGVGRLNPRTGRCEYLPQTGSEKVLSITEDKQKRLYIATLGSGFYQYDLRTGEMKHYESSKDEKGDMKRNELPNDYINYMFCDRKGMMWIGHYKGVSCFDPVTGSFLNNRHTNMIVDGCIGYAFMEDEQGHIWIGTTDGLYRYQKDTGETEHFTTADGLPNNVVCGICEDESHRIWVSTYLGIGCYDRGEGRFVNYYAGDGLQGNEFTHGAFFKDGRGKMYFGGVNGVTCFWPQTVGTSPEETDVWITGFSIHNRPVHKNTLSGGRAVIGTSVQEAGFFRLAHDDNTFSIRFSTLSYSNPEQIFYRYRIEELGKNWQTTAPGDNRVTYNNLAPGTYTFSVQASNHGAFSKVRTIRIQIMPPWNRTWWAYTLYVGLFLLALYGVVNYMYTRARHRKELMQREHAEQLNEAKLQFFINISHEIRTPMTLIINPLEKLLSERRNPEAHQTYLMIYRNAQRILRLINQLMD
ncbi:MAG: hybrid sensor histidine kinase/response regulator, partial [Bacteroides sp.]|nr:hybrid sensor histidine kinase/response regulator [Bacteroides sp.]